MKDISFGLNLNLFCSVIIFLVVLFSCSKSDKDESVNPNNCLRYVEKFRVLYLQNCESLNLPDSIASKDIRHLGIQSSEPINFDVLSTYLNLKKIATIRIDDLDQPVVNLDLAFFSGLRSIQIGGTDKVVDINLLNTGDSLTFVYLSAPNLNFPRFDSTFFGLTYLRYEGKSDVIPQWIETLNHLQEFAFESEYISKIECDVCKMKNLKTFSVVHSDIEDKEYYLSKMTMYPSIQEFKKCKPDLKFWTVLPPK